MAPPVSFTKATLSYPLYAVDFDPYNRGFLVVAGGGGEGRSGVSNKITLLDTLSRSSLDIAAEIELSREEDSVTSLANLASRDGLITLTGINSSEAEQKAGKNEHLRAFVVKYPKRTRKDDANSEKEDAGTISLIGKSSLFAPASGSKPEQYQRLLRLSPARKTAQGSKRIGVVATGLAKKSQLVVFDATRTPAQKSEVINVVYLDDEAADLDVANVGGDFSIAWCTDYAIYEQTVKYDFETREKELIPGGPRNVYTLAKEDKQGKLRVRAKYRSIRFLTDHHVLVLSNLPNKSGAELSIVHLYPTGPGMVVFRKTLPSHTKQAVGMDVCALDADQIGSKQFVVAVAGQDISVEVYTINYSRQTDTFSPFKNFTTLRDVHPLQMTAIRFAQFYAPEAQKDGKLPTSSEQFIRLASVSMGNTVVVDTFAVQLLEPKKATSRYVLSHPTTEKFTQAAYYVLTALIVLVTAMIIQSYYFSSGTSSLQTIFSNSPVVAKPFAPSVGQEQLGTKLEDVIHEHVDHIDEHVASEHDVGEHDQHDHETEQEQTDEQGYVQDLGTEETESESRWSLLDMLHLHRSEAKASGRRSKKAVVLQPLEDGSLQIEEVHNRDKYLAANGNARHWHELDEDEKHSWRRALTRAGEWTVDEGESVLKGVLFSSYAGFVGEVAAEAIRGA